MFDRLDKGLYWDESLYMVDGCTPVSEGCLNCWSAKNTYRLSHNPNEKIRRQKQGLVEIRNGRPVFNGTIRTNERLLDKVIRARKPKVYAIWNDLFHPSVSFEFKMDAFYVMRNKAQSLFFIVTKRADVLFHFWEKTKNCKFWSSPNIWHLITAETQQRADERFPIALQIPGTIIGNLEPMLGPADLSRYLRSTTIVCRCGKSFEAWQADFCGGHIYERYSGMPLMIFGHNDRTLKCPHCGRCACDLLMKWEKSDKIQEGKGRFKWEKSNYEWKSPIAGVILGCESGSKRRHIKTDDIRSVRDQCIDAGVPFFLKQMVIKGSVAKMPVLDGRTWDELPEYNRGQESGA